MSQIKLSVQVVSFKLSEHALKFGKYMSSSYVNRVIVSLKVKCAS